METNGETSHFKLCYCIVSSARPDTCVVILFFSFTVSRVTLLAIPICLFLIAAVKNS